MRGLLLFCVCLAVVVSQECSNPGTTVTSRPEGQDYFVVTLAEYEHVIYWQLTDEEGTPQLEGMEDKKHFKVTPTDCFRTRYSVLIELDCDGDGEVDEEVLGSVEIEPIPIEELTTFTRDDYDILRSNKVNNGDSVTMTCQTAENAAALYDFQPLYTWRKAREFGGSDVVQESSTNNTMVLDSVGCEDAGYYYCKIRRCPQHTEETPACNNNDLVVQEEVPEKTSSKCRVFGDPHVITFDGSIYTYQGRCWYVLAMDSVQYRWFVYGWFSECGPQSSCLESVSIVTRTQGSPGGTTVQLLRGYGFSFGAGEKEFLRRGDTKEIHGLILRYTGRKLQVSIPEHTLTVLWDGLACVTILVDKDTPTLGICGDNDGHKLNDYSSFYDNRNRSSDAFADAWSVGQGCLLSYDMAEPEVPKITSLADLLRLGASPSTMPTSFIRDYCRDMFEGFSGQAAAPQLSYIVELLDTDLVDSFVEACVTDTQRVAADFYDSRYSFQGCIIASILAEEAADLGLCVDRWDVSARCPGPQVWREEAVRIGCIWTAEDAATVLS